MIRFGPSGNDVNFYEQGFKSSIDAPKWLADMGLTALELSFGRGIRLSAETAAQIGEQARKYNISVSAHAPYFINLASAEKDRIQKSYEYIAASLRLLKALNASDGAARLVVHLGSQCKFPRDVAIANTKKNLAWVVSKLKKAGFDNFLLCIETMGRYKAIGTVEEICDICMVDECVIPTIDFGHVNAWTQGLLARDPEKQRGILEYCIKTLGREKMRRPHIHFSAIVYTKAGEHTHTILDNEKWSFPFEPLAKAFKDLDLEPVIICESKDQMAIDAKKLLDIYNGTC